MWMSKEKCFAPVGNRTLKLDLLVSLHYTDSKEIGESRDKIGNLRRIGRGYLI
jgi:hypothetical protein